MVEIRCYPDGPILVRGPILLWQDSSEIEVERDVVALCRCGRSRLAPLCDGSHAARAPLAEPRPNAREGSVAAGRQGRIA